MEKPKFPWGPSFFKVLLLDYTRRLRLPPVFVGNYGEFLHGRAKLRSSSGKTWNVKIGEEIFSNGDKYWCFEGGAWRKFVTDLELDFGEFVFFEFNVCESTFDVSVFGTDCCERAMAVKSDSVCGNLSFSAVLCDYNSFMMDIPIDLARETGITEEKSIKVQNAKGKEWVIGIANLKRGYRNRLSKGWCTFFNENKLVVGSRCLFEFDTKSGNWVVKKEGEFSEREYRRAPIKRGRGRPPIIRGKGKNVLGVEFDSDDESEIRPHKNFVDVESDSGGYEESDSNGDDDSEL